MGKSYSYVRVSTQHQNEDRQLLAMLEDGVEVKNIYIEKKYVKDFIRPMYRKLLRNLEEGDIMIVKNIDCFKRNKEEILNTSRIFTNK